MEGGDNHSQGPMGGEPGVAGSLGAEGSLLQSALVRIQHPHSPGQSEARTGSAGTSEETEAEDTPQHRVGPPRSAPTSLPPFVHSATGVRGVLSFL